MVPDPAPSGASSASPTSATGATSGRDDAAGSPGLPGASGGGNGSGAGNGDGTARVLLDERGIDRSLMRIAHEVIERTDEPDRLYLVAIPNGGIPLARRLAANLRQIADLVVPVGVLDTTLYRDDLLSSGERPPLRRTEMPSAVDDHVVILVDDVVKTGRTIRAAMDALMDFGRPRAVQVVGLVDRGHRELPIKLDYVGKNVPTQPHEQVSLRRADDGSRETLELVILPGPAGSGRTDATGEAGAGAGEGGDA